MTETTEGENSLAVLKHILCFMLCGVVCLLIKDILLYYADAGMLSDCFMEKLTDKVTKQYCRLTDDFFIYYVLILPLLMIYDAVRSKMLQQRPEGWVYFAEIFWWSVLYFLVEYHPAGLIIFVLLWGIGWSTARYTTKAGTFIRYGYCDTDHNFIIYILGGISLYHRFICDDAVLLYDHIFYIGQMFKFMWPIALIMSLLCLLPQRVVKYEGLIAVILLVLYGIGGAVIYSLV